MAIPREAVFSALRDRLEEEMQGVLAGPVSRKYRGGSSGRIPQDDQPGCDLVKGKELYDNGDGLEPPVVTLTANVWIYARNNADPEVGPSVQLHALLDSLEDALAAGDDEPSFGPHTTLGIRNVRRVTIEDVDTDEGSLGDQATAHVVLAIEVVSDPG